MNKNCKRPLKRANPSRSFLRLPQKDPSHRIISPFAFWVGPLQAVKKTNRGSSTTLSSLYLLPVCIFDRWLNGHFCPGKNQVLKHLRLRTFNDYKILQILLFSFNFPFNRTIENRTWFCLNSISVKSTFFVPTPFHKWDTRPVQSLYLMQIYHVSPALLIYYNSRNIKFVKLISILFSTILSNFTFF